MASQVREVLASTELEGRWGLLFETGEIRKRLARITQEYPARRSLELDFHEIDARDTSLSDSLLEFPEATLRSGEKALSDVLPASQPLSTPIRLRVRNLPPTQRVPIHLLREIHLNRFLSIEGIIRRITEVRPQMTEAVFECVACAGHTTVEQDKVSQTLKEASKCSSCDKPLGKTRFTLLPEASRYIDSQKLEIQENPEMLKGGSHPEGLTLLLNEDLTGGLTPGDRVLVSGVLRSIPRTMGSKSSAKQAIFDIVLVVNHVERKDKEYSEIELTAEDRAEIEALRGEPGVFERFVDSMAPTIQGMRIEKEAIALQLFGGVPKKQPDGINIRGDIHVLLVGDPGTAKSQLLRYVSQIAPRGIYTSGKGSTAAGLTAAAVKDDFGGGRWTLEAGSMVLADQGMVCIDELDKMTENDRSSMHESLEQQSYHPSFEIMLMNGEKRQIGELVDGLFSHHPDRAVQGKDCQILPLDGGERPLLLTTDFIRLDGAHADRVSRHAAPSRFIRLTYENGRTITVTPEHPVYIWQDDRFTAVPAETVRPGEAAPGVRWYPRALNEAVLRPSQVSDGGRQLLFPTEIDCRLARLLGYVVSQGQVHSAKRGQTAEVLVGSVDNDLARDVQNLFMDLFGLEPIIQVQRRDKEDGSTVIVYQVRAPGRAVCDYFHVNFPESVRDPDEKRIPGQIFHATEACRTQFMVGAFGGDGFHDSERLGLTTRSSGLALDYSDLLLSLGIYSYIAGEDDACGNYERARAAHKVVASGAESQRRFHELVSQHDPRSWEIRALLRRSESKPKDEDLLPTHLVSRLRDLLRMFGLDEGHLSVAVKNKGGYPRSTFQDSLARVRGHIGSLPAPPDADLTPRELRKAYHVRVDEIARLSGRSSAWVRLHDENASSAQGKTVRAVVTTLSLQKLSRARRELSELSGWLSSPIMFVPIREVETVPNSGVKWVYDVTVEPTHAFISEGLVLHNTVSVSKAGITATLRARCPVLAAANPRLGRFSPDRDHAEEINLPPTLLSRFDVIFAIQDKPDEAKDRSLAGAILAKHSESEEREALRARGTSMVEKSSEVTGLFQPEFMRKYIAYARTNVYPVMDDIANRTLLDFFVTLRKQGEGENKPVPITLRQVEGLVRLTEASARSRLSPVAGRGDAERAIKVVEHFMKTILQSQGGAIDIDYIAAGMTTNLRVTVNSVRDIMVELDKRMPHGFTEDMVLAEAEKRSIGKERALRAISDLKRVNEVFEPRTGFLKLMR